MRDVGIQPLHDDALGYIARRIRLELSDDGVSVRYRVDRGLLVEVAYVVLCTQNLEPDELQENGDQHGVRRPIS
jgi:hypothetical protein